MKPISYRACAFPVTLSLNELNSLTLNVCWCHLCMCGGVTCSLVHTTFGWRVPKFRVRVPPGGLLKILKLKSCLLRFLWESPSCVQHHEGFCCCCCWSLNIDTWLIVCDGGSEVGLKLQTSWDHSRSWLQSLNVKTCGVLVAVKHWPRFMLYFNYESRVAAQATRLLSAY